MKSILIAIATIVAACTQVCCIGQNGLTLISIPMIIFLGIEAIDKVTKKEERV